MKVLPVVRTSALSATDTEPKRVKAVAADGRMVVSDWDHSKDMYENHLAAAARLYPEGTHLHVLAETWLGYHFTVNS